MSEHAHNQNSHEPQASEPQLHAPDLSDPHAREPDSDESGAAPPTATPAAWIREARARADRPGEDWTRGPAKWVAAGLVGGASLVGLAWSIVARPPAPAQIIERSEGDRVAERNLALLDREGFLLSAASDAPVRNPGPTTSYQANPSPGPDPLLLEMGPPAPSASDSTAAGEGASDAASGGVRRADTVPAGSPKPVRSPSVERVTREITVPASRVTPLNPPTDRHTDAPSPTHAPATEVQRREDATNERSASPSESPKAAPLIQRININTASQAELETLPGIGPTLARRILEHRAKQGPFKRVDDLTDVKGVGDKILAQVRPLARVE
ncbi:MAG: helix-hairpin-helix domain-containing protein [Planctomycetota bacterium]|nr:helix-hairpin-helix domain-containing protein [Planctomycetota bacterium]